jgi:hypothetical protein
MMMPSPRPWRRYDIPTYDQMAATVAQEANEIAAALEELADSVSPVDLSAKALLLQAAADCAEASRLLRKGQG